MLLTEKHPLGTTHNKIKALDRTQCLKITVSLHQRLYRGLEPHFKPTKK